MSKEKQKKKNWGKIVFLLIMLFAGMACGVIAGEFLGKSVKEGRASWGYLLILLIAMYLSMFVQIIVHEAGHLVFGLATGYQFSSFRIGSLIFIKLDDKIKLRKYSLAGTGGQCLMSPPDMIDGQIPVVLYNLGGCIMNVISALVFGVVAYFAQGNKVLFVFAASMVVMGVAYASANGIPMQVGQISNDGHNALSLGKNPAAKRAFWLQLKINEQVAKGKRLKELPASWFAVPADEDMNNGLVTALAVFHANWLMDQSRLEEAAEYMKQLLHKKTGIIGLHRSLLINDRIYCELIVNKNTSEAIYLHNKEHEKFVKQMKNHPSIIRSEYAYALLVEKDEEKAEKLLTHFEKVAKTYPYAQDIESEKELMERCSE